MMFILHSIKTNNKYIKSITTDASRIGFNLEIIAKDTNTNELIEITSEEELKKVYGVVHIDNVYLLVEVSDDSWKALDYIEDVKHEYYNERILPNPLSYRSMLKLCNRWNVSSYYSKERDAIIIEGENFLLRGLCNSLIIRQSRFVFTSGATIYDFLSSLFRNYTSVFNKDIITVITTYDDEATKFSFRISPKFRAFCSKKCVLRKNVT